MHRLIPLLLIASTALAGDKSLAVTADGEFQGWKLGAPFEAGKRAKAGETPDTWVVEGVKIGGQALRTILTTKDGKLASVRMSFEVSGKPATKALTEWTDAVCRPFTPSVDRFMPSPLGTPPDDGDWDPVFLSKGRCSGEVDGVQVVVREETAEASDFKRGDVRVWLTPTEKAAEQGSTLPTTHGRRTLHDLRRELGPEVG